MVPLIRTHDKYEDSFPSVRSKYICQSQYTRKEQKSTKLWPVHICQKNCKVSVKETVIY